MLNKNRRISILQIALLIALMASLFGIYQVQADSVVALGWARSFSGISYDEGLAIAVDNDDNVYTTGSFSDTVDFDPGAGIVNLTSAGESDIFISKLDSSGGFVWAKRIGGVSSYYSDSGNSIVVDGSGNVYTTGNFSGTVDFDPGAGVANLTSAGITDIFIMKLDTDGEFIWAKSMGGVATNNSGVSIALDTEGNVYTTGYFTGTVDFDPGAGISNLTSVAEEDVYISKLDTNGNYIWAKSFGGTWFDGGSSIKVDAGGNIYTVGHFYFTVDFDPGAATSQPITSAGSDDIFITKHDTNGNLIWVKNMGGVNGDFGQSIEIDTDGNLYITGNYFGITDLDPGVHVASFTSNGSYDIFISKLDNHGNFIWAKSMGGINADYGISISVDDRGIAYIIGSFMDTVDFDPGIGTTNLTSSGGHDIFISKFDNNGNFVWAQSVGGPANDYGSAIVIQDNWKIYTTGSFKDMIDFDPGAGTSNLISSGESDIFINKLLVTSFSDVPLEHPHWKEIEILYMNGYTAGCSVSPSLFCPDVIMNRAQAAVFMMRGNFGSGYVPAAPTHFFADNWVTAPWAESWAEAMFNANFSAGCSASPLRFCPYDQLTNAQAAVVGLRLKYGMAYTPPPATGTVFADLTDINFWGTSWAEQAYVDGLIPSCGTSGGKPMFCPNALVSRGFGAYIIVQAKNLTMP